MTEEQYTEQDLAFLKAAKEVASLHPAQIDPTIRDILNRLQYEHAPHGGLPIRQSDFEQHNLLQQHDAEQLLFATPPDFPQLSMDIFKHEHQPLQVLPDRPTPQQQAQPPPPPPQQTADTPRNYLCDVCSLSFKRSSDLKRHEKIHLEVPPNVCPQCSKGFARKDALKRHINTVTCKRNRERMLLEQQFQQSQPDQPQHWNVS